MKDYIDLFNERDSKLESLEKQYREDAPRCCVCGEAILGNTAQYMDGNWYCDKDECQNEFTIDAKDKHRKNIA